VTENAKERPRRHSDRQLRRAEALMFTTGSMGGKATLQG